MIKSSLHQGKIGSAIAWWSAHRWSRKRLEFNSVSEWAAGIEGECGRTLARRGCSAKPTKQIPKSESQKTRSVGQITRSASHMTIICRGFLVATAPHQQKLLTNFYMTRSTSTLKVSIFFLPRRELALAIIKKIAPCTHSDVRAASPASRTTVADNCTASITPELSRPTSGLWDRLGKP